LIALSHCASVGLYGVAPSLAQLVSVDPKTAANTPIGNPLPNDYDAQGLATIDDTNEVIYLIASDLSSTPNQVVLLGLSLNDGSIKTKIRLPFSVGAFIGVGQNVNFDPISGDVFVSGRDPSVDDKHRIYRVSVSSGTLTPIASFGGIDVLGGASAYDPVNQVLWLSFGTNTSIDLYGFDVKTGKILFNIDDSTYNMETMDFDPVTGLVYGIGLTAKNDSYASRTVVALNSKNGQMSQIAIIDKDEFWIIDGDASGLDWTNRVLYCFLQERGADSNPFRLVGVDMRSGKVVNGSPVACSSDGSDCAWSLEFHNRKK